VSGPVTPWPTRVPRQSPPNVYRSVSTGKVGLLPDDALPVMGRPRLAFDRGGHARPRGFHCAISKSLGYEKPKGHITGTPLPRYSRRACHPPPKARMGHSSWTCLLRN